MLISYNLLHCLLRSYLIFIPLSNVHLFADIFIKLDSNKSVCIYVYVPSCRGPQSKFHTLSAWPNAHKHFTEGK